ncbi:MAG: UvrB/UvrC motif-containing protein [Dethiobacteria bacterium]
MLCQECRRNEANIHIVKNIHGKQTELNLCEECARKKDELDFTFEPQFSLHKLFSSMLNQSLRDARESNEVANTQCQSCGLTFAQFSQVGRLGCGDCFAAFEDKLKPLLRRIHAGSAHNGKVPVKVQGRVRAIRQIDQLKEELQVKIQNEEFEDAALLRDRIRELESAVDKGATVVEEDDNSSSKGEKQ